MTRKAIGGSTLNVPKASLATPPIVSKGALRAPGAFASFEERDRGHLEVGNYADLVVLRENLLTIPRDRIAAATRLMTVTNGKVTFEGAVAYPPAGSFLRVSSKTVTDPYRTFGVGYAEVRRADPRIASQLHAALGSATTVINVGAGAGSYEPAGRRVLAVEPSVTMVSQRDPGAAPVVRAAAEALPCGDGRFDVALALLTVHHWRDPVAGLAELRRVARRQVVLTWDVEVMARYWLVADYLPEITARERGLATVDTVLDVLEGAEARVVEVPGDCTDGFLAAYWRRPAAYLDDGVRAGMSGVAALDRDTVVGPAMDRLAEDLRTGAWERRHGDLLSRASLDVGYRLVVT